MERSLFFADGVLLELLTLSVFGLLAFIQVQLILF
jgi:hypothetical protein